MKVSRWTWLVTAIGLSINSQLLGRDDWRSFFGGVLAVVSTICFWKFMSWQTNPRQKQAEVHQRDQGLNKDSD